MTVIPQHVTQRYLEPYTEGQRAELEAAFLATRASILEGMRPLPAKPDRRLIMTAGAEGVGKSVYLRKLVAEAAKSGDKIALIDWEAVMESIPSFAQTRRALADYFEACVDSDGHAHAMSREWILGAKWVGDQLLNDFAARGLPIAFETTAHGSNIREFLTSFREAGYSIDLHLGDAPMDVKVASVNRHHQHDKTAYVDAATIERKSADIRRNTEYYSEQTGTLTLLWRATVNGNLKPIARSYGHEREVEFYDRAAVAAFDANHPDTAMKAAELLKSHIYYTSLRPRANVPA